jgi:hypothetical protein
VPSQGIAQPYAMIGGIIKNLSSSDRANGALCQGFTLDKYGQTQITATLTDTADVRQKYYMYGPTASCATRQFSLTYRLADAGLRTRGGWLPPNCQIQIRARRSQPQMMRIGKGTEVTAAAPIFTVTSATCMMARKVLSIESRAKLEAMWTAMPLRVPFEQTRTSVNWFGVGAQDINLSNQLAGPTPSAVMVFVVPDASINQTSNGETNPAQLYPGDGAVLQNVSLSVGGYRKYPIQPLSMVSNTNADPNISGSSLDVGTAYQLYRACANEQPFLNDVDFTNVLPLCFAIAGSKEAWNLTEDVSVAFQARLSVSPTAKYAVVMISFTDALMEFSREGQVLVA